MTINPVIIVSANDIAFPTPTAEDKLRLAVAGYLSPYKGKTLSGHTYALNRFLTWCADPEHHVDPLHAQRGHIELYIRWMETTGWASATIAGRYDVVRGFYRADQRAVPRHPDQTAAVLGHPLLVGLRPHALRHWAPPGRP